jgi:hypothetical protein
MNCRSTYSKLFFAGLLLGLTITLCTIRHDNLRAVIVPDPAPNHLCNSEWVLKKSVLAVPE